MEEGQLRQFAPFRVWALCLVLVLTSGCETAEGYRQLMDTWVGAHADELVASWGPPDRFYENADGSRVLQYSDASSYYVPGTTYSSPVTTYNWDGSISTAYNTYTSPGYSVDTICVSTFFTDQDHRIIRWTGEGDDCVAEEISE